MESAAEVVPAAAPIEGHEESSGEVETTVQQVAGLVRTLREHVEFFSGFEVPANHPIMAWTEHAGTMLSLISRARDGLTPYNRQKGKLWRVALAPFGESVESSRRARHKLGACCGPEVFL